MFKDDFYRVQDSISKIKTYLEIFQKERGSSSFNYHYEGKSFFVNDKFIGTANNFNLDTLKDLGVLCNTQKLEFLHLAKFLFNNHLEGGYWDPQTFLWRFFYRYVPPGLHEHSREIVVIDSDEISLPSHGSKILQEKDKTMLLAPDDIEISKAT